MIADVEVIIRITIKKSEYHTAIFRQFVFCCQIREELYCSIGSLLGCQANVEATSDSKSQALIHKTLNDRQVKICAVIRICGGIRIIEGGQSRTIIYGRIKIHTQAFVFKCLLELRRKIAAHRPGYIAGYTGNE